jgi:hypothetical protein
MKVKKIFIIVLSGYLLSVLFIGYNFYMTNYKEKPIDKLACFPEAKYINGKYISIFRMTDSIYAIEVRDNNGTLVNDGFFTYHGSDESSEVYESSIKQYNSNSSILLKNGMLLSIRKSR